MDDDKVDPTFRKLYPHLSEKELLEAHENLDRYLEHALRVHERLRADPKAWAQFKVYRSGERQIADQ